MQKLGQSVTGQAQPVDGIQSAVGHHRRGGGIRWDFVAERMGDAAGKNDAPAVGAGQIFPVVFFYETAGAAHQKQGHQTPVILRFFTASESPQSLRFVVALAQKINVARFHNVPLRADAQIGVRVHEQPQLVGHI